MRRISLTLLVALAMSGCTTPYRPAVPVHGSQDFPGLVGLPRSGTESGAEAQHIDIVLVHGMCTHHDDWANIAIDTQVKTVDPTATPTEPANGVDIPGAGGIQIVRRTKTLAGTVSEPHAQARARASPQRHGRQGTFDPG